MGLKSYFAPAKAKKDVEMKEKEKHAAPVVNEKQDDSTMASTPRPFSQFNTPNGQSPWGSRPASIAPNGEYRMSQHEELNEIKCDVMVNWLYQQQMEKLWTAGGHDEGVVLKKGKGAYTCCPADIIEEPYGFFKAIETLNVRVCIACTIFKIEALLTRHSVR